MMAAPVVEKERRGGWIVTCRAFVVVESTSVIIRALKRRLGHFARPEGRC
jgi:hypothetical protein